MNSLHATGMRDCEDDPSTIGLPRRPVNGGYSSAWVVRTLAIPLRNPARL